MGNTNRVKRGLFMKIPGNGMLGGPAKGVFRPVFLRFETGIIHNNPLQPEIEK